MAQKKPKSPAARTKAPAAAQRFDVKAALRREARDETLGAIAGVLSHEANNLLGALKTSVQILRKNPHLSGDDLELLDIVDSASRRLNEIVAEFSQFSASRELDLQNVDLHQVIDETLSLLRRDERCVPAIVFHRHFDRSVESVKADPDRLRQILWHLFLNAVQAMGDEGELHVTTQQAGNELKILVRDTGPGISSDLLENVFEPLVTTKPRGVGLGLAIARRNIERHKGRIKVENTLASGTCFSVVLPAERD